MPDAMLVTRVGGVTCAFPIEHVVETLRPLPIERVGTHRDPALDAIAGVAIVRGAPVAVIDLARLLGVAGEHAARFVIVQIADRRVALVVDEVVGVQRVDRAAFDRLPPVLRGVRSDSVSAIGARDTELVLVLDAARLVPDEDPALAADAAAEPAR